MGLSFHGSKAGWSYIGFDRFRRRLLASGYAPELKTLLEHSDCEGEISPNDCAKLAPFIRKAVEGWEEDDYDRIHGLLLAEGMEICADKNESLFFS